ncbi:beta-lactamase family protein [Acetobacteraceae bacterium H6797]|nr:beta-lactamase family protein [Acetobacteraceae bacterium H6797]
MRRLLIPAIGAAIALAAPLQAAEMQQRLDSLLDKAVDNGPIVGTVVMVAEKGQIVYHRAAGFSDRETRQPMREDTIFRFASLTKPIVTVAALSLIQEGKLSPDDPVTRYIPDFRPRLADGQEAVITVRQLMTHTAGLSYRFAEPKDGPHDRANVSDGLDQPGLPIEENLRRIASVPLSYKPGESWGYSVATDVLGEVVARAGGAPLPDVVHRRVTEPLGMANTAFTVTGPERLAAPYADGTPPMRMRAQYELPYGQGVIRFAPSRVFDPVSFPSGGAGMTGTAEDYVTFLEALRKGGSPVLNEASARSLATEAVANLPQGALDPGWGFGLGVAVLRDPAATGTPQSAGTWAWGGVYGHSWFVDPARELVVVIMTNTAVAGMTGAFPNSVRDAVYGKAP